MPAVSESQRRFMGAELARARKGQPTRTQMSISQLKEFAMKDKDHMMPKEHKKMSKMAPKSHMPKGASMKGAWGDIGVTRQREGAAVGGAKLFKGTKTVSSPWK